MNGAALNPRDLALSRSYSYRLFGRIFLEGLTPDLLPYVQQIEPLAAEIADPFDPDSAAAAHHTLFQFNIFPRQSFFLGHDGLVGGAISAELVTWFARAGWPAATLDQESDHLGHQLLFLAFLCEREAQAVPPEALRQAQRTFLESHLLRWGIACLIAVEQQGDGFFGRLAALTRDLLLDHFGTIPPDLPILPPDFLPAPVPLLDHDKTGFRDIARHLMLPAFSGICLSRDDLGTIARTLALPRGFGNREQMVTTLLQSAVQYETLPALLDALRNHCLTWESAWQSAHSQFPAARPWLAPWLRAVQHTNQLLARMRESAAP
jgi:TorA maturation chaperone TorD